jgi:hypothetical protein
MRKAVKVTGFVLVGIIALAVLAAGAWIYVMGNVEQPDYRVVAQDGKIEVRDYPALVVAEVVREGPRKAAVSAGFRALAAYIFAKERGGDSIAMTAPVTQQRDAIAMTAPVTQSALSADAPPAPGEDGRWAVRFIMPAEYSLETLPPPASPDVRLKALPATRRAAIRFSGVATDALIAEQESRLRAWLDERGLESPGPATYAYYNDPFTPGFLRRNEVILDLPADSDG